MFNHTVGPDQVRPVDMVAGSRCIVVAKEHIHSLAVVCRRWISRVLLVNVERYVLRTGIVAAEDGSLEVDIAVGKEGRCSQTLHGAAAALDSKTSPER